MQLCPTSSHPTLEANAPLNTCWTESEIGRPSNRLGALHRCIASLHMPKLMALLTQVESSFPLSRGNKIPQVPFQQSLDREIPDTDQSQSQRTEQSPFELPHKLDTIHQDSTRPTIAGRLEAALIISDSQINSSIQDESLVSIESRSHLVGALGRMTQFNPKSGAPPTLTNGEPKDEDDESDNEHLLDSEDRAAVPQGAAESRATCRKTKRFRYSIFRTGNLCALALIFVPVLPACRPDF